MKYGRFTATLRQICLWLLTAFLLFLCINIQDPHFLPWRSLLNLMIAAIATIILLCFRRHTRYYRWSGHVVVFFSVACACYAQWTVLHYKTHILQTQALPGFPELGQHLVAGFSDWHEIEMLAQRGLIGGIYLTRRNVQKLDRDTIRHHVCHLQNIRRQAGLPPLLFAADQEGGIVKHLTPPLPDRDGLGAIIADNPLPPGSMNTQAQQQLAFTLGQNQGADLRRIGVNINLSPVVDLNIAHSRPTIDRNSQISRRAISSDPSVTHDMALAYINGLRQSGIHGTLKHFPGLGHVSSDTHHFTADTTLPLAALQKMDWLPFREISRQSDALMMFGHVRVTAVDPDWPASFSHKLIQGIIRKNWRSDAVLITDDFSMSAAYNYGLCTATRTALNAGTDLLLISFDHNKKYDMLYCLSEAAQQGTLDMTLLAQSAARLERLLQNIPQDCP